jgi:hypothetical protein
MRPACRLLCLLVIVVAAACEQCPDRRVPIALRPDRIARGGGQEVTVRFPTAVFIGEQPDRERDVRATLRDPGGAVVGSWRGDEPGSGEGVVTGARVVDPHTLALRLDVERSARSGPHEVTVIGDLAGACRGPWGTSTLTVT